MLAQEFLMHGAEGTSAYNSSLLRNISIPIKVFGNKRAMMGYEKDSV